MADRIELCLALMQSGSDLDTAPQQIEVAKFPGTRLVAPFDFVTASRVGDGVSLEIEVRRGLKVETFGGALIENGHVYASAKLEEGVKAVTAARISFWDGGTHYRDVFFEVRRKDAN
jgi:hypothetical protein